MITPIKADKEKSSMLDTNYPNDLLMASLKNPIEYNRKLLVKSELVKHN